MMITELSNYFDEWDPMGFIADLGAPNGEYSSEAADIFLKAKRDMSNEQIADLVYKVFTDSIEIDPDGFYGQCQTRAVEIQNILFGD